MAVSRTAALNRLLSVGCCISLLLSTSGVESRALHAPTPASQTTDVAAPGTTSPPPQADMELMIVKRVVGDNTCGYVQGNINSPLTCSSRGTCSSDSSSSAIGCCTSFPCALPTTCVDFAASYFGYCSIPGPGTTCCNISNNPYCAIHTYIDIGMTMAYCTSMPITTTIRMMYDPSTVAAATGATAKPVTTRPTTGDSNLGSSGDSNIKTAESGLSQSDKIALGCGIGVALPATLAGLYMAWKVARKRS